MNRSTIEQVVLESGLWSPGQESSHGFVLSPSVYEINQAKAAELAMLGEALHGCLSGLGRIAAIAANPRLTSGSTWGMLARVMRTGVPDYYHGIMMHKPSTVPAICKIDLMEALNGRYQIAEIDGHNKHGLGYSTLAARIRRAIRPDTKSFPGVAVMLSQEIGRRGNGHAALLYSDQERFYLPEFRVLRSELALNGINLYIVAESEVKVQDGFVVEPKGGEKCRLLVDFPFLYHNPNLTAALVARYEEGKVDFLIPPKPFLGSKAILALLCNDSENEELEAILRSQIKPSSLFLLRQYIPATFLVQKRGDEDTWQRRRESGRFVLKESISSGMKGVLFPEDSGFDAMWQKARSSYYHYILQEEVCGATQRFQYFAEDGTLREDDWYMRVTVHYATRRVADIIVTARRDKRVHGATDCLQIGAVVI